MCKISPSNVNLLTRYGAFVFFLVYGAAGLAAELPASVAAALKHAKIPESAIALYVQDVNQVTPVLTLNEQRAMNPASVMKLVNPFCRKSRSKSQNASSVILGSP